MKVVIKGDRNTGKTCLWNILQRKPFLTEYLPTSDSQFTHINWEYKGMPIECPMCCTHASRPPASYDTITVEVWDVVDKSAPTAPPCPSRRRPSLRLTSLQRSGRCRA